MMIGSKFNFSSSFEAWRNELTAQRGLSPDARRELEAHLQDLFTELRQSGLSDEEAFERARKRVGELHLINREFKIALNRAIHHWAFGIVAWGGFIVSFFLVAYDQMSGWKSATLQDFFWPQAMQGDLFAVHYLFLTLANALVVASPFFMRLGLRHAYIVKWLRSLSFATTVLVLLFLAHLLFRNLGHDLRAGFYLWAGSFVLLFMASLLQPVPLKTRGDVTTRAAV